MIPINNILNITNSIFYDKHKPFRKKGCHFFEKCSAGHRHEWYLGVSGPYKIAIVNIPYNIYKYYEFVYPIGIK